jgi:hypothetical protein
LGDAALDRPYRYRMTELGQRPISMPPWTPPPNRRRQVFRVVAALLVVILLGGGIGSVVYAHHYQPLDFGGEWSALGPNLGTLTDGVDRTGMIATGPSGSVSTIRTTLTNGGHFDIKLLGVADDTFPGHESVRWQVARGGFDLAAPDSAWTTEAITLHPGQIVGVAIDIVRPACHSGETVSIQNAPIRWSGLGVHHIYELNLAGGVGSLNFNAPMYLCYPRTALKHLAYPLPAAS